MGGRSVPDLQNGRARTRAGGSPHIDRQLAPAREAIAGAEVTDAEDTIAREILASARRLLDRSSEDTRGLWPRAAVLLQRQAIEVGLKTYWSAKAPGVEECSTRAQ